MTNSKKSVKNKVAPDPYRELFERSADAILIIEGETFVECNQATVEMLRYATREEVLRTHPSELSPPTQPDGRDSYEKANEMIAIAFELGSHRFEWNHKRADGEVFPVDVLLTAVKEDGRRVLHVVWRDITERKHLEQQLRQAQKMEALGSLVGGVAHDFNNLLVAIIGNAELVATRLTDQSDLLKKVSQIERAGKRAAQLVHQLLAFSRSQEVQPRIFVLQDVLREIDGLLQRLISEDITLVLSTDSIPMKVKADPAQVEQMILNLVSNARDAMPRGGTLSIELRKVGVSRTSIGDRQPLAPGTYALLCVSDNGEGMSAETAAKAFEPFFTTKEVGKGTGLGLATVYGVARRAGGKTTIYSNPGIGTSVKVYIPLTNEAVHEVPDTDLGLSAGGQETVLVVEDEVIVSSLVVSVLETMGYTVLLANNGMQGLDVYDDETDRIELVLTDVVMPRLGGPEMVTKLRERGYKGPVLFTSGYTNNTLKRLQGVEGEVDLLEKPFSPRDLVNRVRKTLDRRGDEKNE